MTQPIDGTTKLGTAIVVVLCATLVFTTLLYGGVDSGVIALIALSTTVILCLWAASVWKSGEFRLNVTYLYAPIIGWLIIGLIQLLPTGDVGMLTDILGTPASASLSFDQYATRFFLIRLVFYFVFLAAALTFFNSEGTVRRVTWSIIIFGSSTAFFGILQWLAKPDAIYGLRATPQAIPFGPFVNQHHFAALMEMMSGLTLGVLFGGGTKKDKRPLLLIAAILMVVAIVLTGSRGGVISFLGVVLFAGLATFGLQRNKGASGDGGNNRPLSRRLLPVAIAAAAVVMLVSVVVFLGGEQSLLRGSGIVNQQTDLSSGRTQFWSVGLHIFLSHPLIGTGFDTFGVAYTRFDPSNGVFRVEQAHNDYLQTLADGGILAFICLFAFVYLLFRNGIAAIGKRHDQQMRSISIGCLAGCFGILVHSLFDFPLRTPANAFFFLMLIALAVVEVGGSKKKLTKSISEH
ncbi:MAG: O-antigen ligase family protein [Acidobacteriota bacterium]